jgi:hypothetical protein
VGSRACRLSATGHSSNAPIYSPDRFRPKLSKIIPSGKVIARPIHGIRNVQPGRQRGSLAPLSRLEVQGGEDECDLAS